MFGWLFNKKQDIPDNTFDIKQQWELELNVVINDDS